MSPRQLIIAKAKDRLRKAETAWTLYYERDDESEADPIGAQSLLKEIHDADRALSKL